MGLVQSHVNAGARLSGYVKNRRFAGSSPRRTLNSNRRKLRARSGRSNLLHRCRHLKDNETMSGIQFVTDEKGRKVAVQIDLKKYGSVLEDFWDGLISESRRKEKGIPLEKIKADLVKRGRLRE
jgi:hypothetical protein